MAPHTPDTEAFAQLLTRHQSRLYAFVFSNVSDAQLAHDVFQDTNRVLWEKADEFDHSRDFMPWAFAIARVQARAARQRLGRDRLAFDEDVVTQLVDRAEELAERHDDRQVALAQCLQRLAPQQRTLVEQRYREGQSVQDIATASSRRPNVIAVALHRVRRALARCIEETVAGARA